MMIYFLMKLVSIRRSNDNIFVIFKELNEPKTKFQGLVFERN